LPDAGISFGEWIAGTKRYYGSGEFLSDISLALPTIFSGSSAQCEGRRFVPSSSRSVPDLQSHPFLRTPNDLLSRLTNRVFSTGGRFLRGPRCNWSGGIHVQGLDGPYHGCKHTRHGSWSVTACQVHVRPNGYPLTTQTASGRLLVTLINSGGALLLGLLLDWKLLLVCCAPLLLLGPAGWAGIHYTSAYFGAIEIPNSAATTLAVEAVDAMRVSLDQADFEACKPLFDAPTHFIHQTVSAFGQERRMVESFDKMQRPKDKKHIGLLFKAALCFGASQALIPVRRGSLKLLRSDRRPLTRPTPISRSL
jgi:hypothetical protein